MFSTTPDMDDLLLMRSLAERVDVSVCGINSEVSPVQRTCFEDYCCIYIYSLTFGHLPTLGYSARTNNDLIVLSRNNVIRANLPILDTHLEKKNSPQGNNAS